MDDFATLLFLRRETLKLTQAQLAEQAGLHVNTIFGYEKGIKKPRAASLSALCEALYVDPTYFQPQSKNESS